MIVRLGQMRRPQGCRAAVLVNEVNVGRVDRTAMIVNTEAVLVCGGISHAVRTAGNFNAVRDYIGQESRGFVEKDCAEALDAMCMGCPNKKKPEEEQSTS